MKTFYKSYMSFKMFSYLKIAEQRIKEAQERGDFDNLPGEGEPLDLQDDRNIPEDLRLAHKILKNADCLPPELEEKKEIRQMEDMLDNIPDEIVCRLSIICCHGIPVPSVSVR